MRIPVGLLLTVALGGNPVLAEPQEAHEPLAQDTLKLKNGNLFEGRVLSENDRTVTIRIGPGQVLEVPKQIIATLARVSRKDDPGKDGAAQRLRPRSEWFLLRNGEGRVLGKLHILVKAEEQGGYRLEEQWSFHEEDRRRMLVSRIETVDARLRPRTCFYRETVLGRSAQKALDEKLYQGEVQDEQLLLKTFDKQGRRQRKLPFQRGNLFPLLVEELLREGEARGARTFHASIYDPMEGLFELRRYELCDGVAVPESLIESADARQGRVRLVEWQSGGRTKREWISADGKILLIEVNGVHLVAEPISAELGTSLVRPEKLRAQRSFHELAELEIWLPRATWRFGRTTPTTLEILPPTPKSRVRAILGRGGEEPQHLQGVAEKMLSRWNLDHAWFQEKGQELFHTSGHALLRVHGGGKTEGGRLRLGEAVFLATPRGHLMLVAEAPATDWPSLSLEFREMTELVATSVWKPPAEPGK